MRTDWIKTKTAPPRNSCVCELFEEQVERTPDAVAVVFEAEQVTYRELNARANQLAHYLRARGVWPEVLVGLCVERSLLMVVGLLGILKAGGAYVPMDPAYPQERLQFILEDAAAPLLITQRNLLASLPSKKAQTICLDDDWESIGRESDEDPDSEVVAENLAYIIYTSGSTGKPKGVAIQHKSVVELMNWAGSVFSSDELQGVLASTSICFDLSVFELFVTLSLGGCVILADDALHLADLKAASRVTLINTVPSAMTELLRMGAIPESVTTVNLAGEPLKTSLVKQIHELRHVQRVFDLYGPSEDTTYSTFALRLPDGPATIGRPISNTEAYLLDSNFKPVSEGVAGEIYLGGQGLARGYLNRPDITAERFVPNPFSSAPSTRLYRTGDLGRYLAGGDIEYLGRIDHQVKIRGYRIELGEIEAVVSQHPSVRETLVMAREDEPGDKRLVAYVVPGPKDSGVESSVNEALQSVQISQWQAVWNETYREKAPLREPAFNIVGWNSRHTGEPIALQEMKQRVDYTVEWTLSLGLKRGAGSSDECDLELMRSDSTIVELAAMDQKQEELKSREKSRSRYDNNPLQAEVDRDLVPELRRFLKEKLPEHMIPSAFVLLSALPLTANGKIDRRALPAPSQSRLGLATAYVAPRTPAEEMLSTIWGEVLKLEQIGVNDNFFDLGGHSLVAVRLFAEIENKFGEQLPLSTLFEAPTISQLAAILQRGSRPSWTSLVPIQPQGTKPPLFCVHACGAHVFIYRPLVAYLGPDQPVYGLQAQGIDGTQEPYSHIEDMAAHYIREIRDLEPHGPYYLVGDTLGGLIAFEMAQQLKRQGEDVALLAMFDTFCPLPLSFGPRLLSHLSHLKQLGPRKYLLAAGRSLAKKLGIRFSENLTQIGMSVEEQDNAGGISASGNALQRTEWAIYLATHVNYRPPQQRFPGRLTYFLARDNQYAAGEKDDRRGWKRWAAEFDLHLIPGRHRSISSEPDVAGLAEKFMSCLNKAQANIRRNVPSANKEGKRRPRHTSDWLSGRKCEGGIGFSASIER